MLRRDFLGGGAAWLGASLPLLEGCAPDRPLRIATNVWPGYEALYVARTLGTLPASVRLIELLNATQVLSAMRTGMVEAAALTLDETLSLVSRGVPLRVVGVFDASAGADALVARYGERLGDLKGARIGVENTALGAYFLSRALEKAGLGLADVKVVRQDISQQEGAFLAGSVDAVVTFDPVRERLVQLGGTVLLDSRELPNEILDVLVTRTDVVDDPDLRGILAAVLRAVDSVVSALAPGSPLYARMARRLSLTPAQVEHSFGGLKLASLQETLRLLRGPSPPLEQQAAALAARLVASRLLPTAPRLDGLADARAAEGALG